MHHEHPYPARYRFWIPLIAVVYLLVIFSLLFGITAARFRAGANGSAQIHIASFAANTATVTGGDLTVDCSADETTATYTFSVSNYKDGVTAEVDIGYWITVAVSSPLPSGVNMSIDGKSGTTSNDGLVYSFESDTWVMTAGTKQTTNHTLTFTVDPDALTDSVQIDNVNVSVTVEQIN